MNRKRWRVVSFVMESLSVGGWVFMVVLFAGSGLYWSALAITTVGGYLLFRIHWSRTLALTYDGLATAARAAKQYHPDDLDAYTEDLAALMPVAHEAAARRYWVAHWPFAGLFFRLKPIPPCSCGGPRLFLDRGVKQPPFPAVCIVCRHGARDCFEEGLARAAARVVERAWSGA